MQINEFVAEKDFTLKRLWDDQHPIMHMWFVFSSISIGVMYALFFVIL